MAASALTLLVEHVAQGQVRLGQSGFQPQALLQRRARLRKSALRPQHAAELEMCLGKVGPLADHDLEGLERLAPQTFGLEQVAEIESGLDEIGPNPQRLAVCRDCLVGLVFDP